MKRRPALWAVSLLLAGCAGVSPPRAASPDTAVAANGPAWTWSDHFGGRGRDAPRAVAMARDGSVYSVGQLAHGREDDERSLTGDAARELMFLARHEPDGRRAWLLRFGGSPVDEPRAVAVAPDGTVLVAGLFTGELALGSAEALVLRSIGGADVFLAAFDADGVPRWALSWGGKYADAARALAVDAAGHVYVAGTFQLTADFDPGPGRNLLTSAGRTDTFVLELDPARQLLWAYRFGSLGTDEVTGLAVAADGSVYLGGSFEGYATEIVDGRPGTLRVGGGPFVLALAPDGAERWLRTLDAGVSASLAGLAASPDGAVYAGGTFQGRLRFHGKPALDDPDGRGAFAARLDASGDLGWLRALPSLTTSALTATAEGLLLSGSFRGDVDFDPGPARRMLEAETTTAFLAALDAGGELRWAAPTAAGLGAVLGIATGEAGRGAVIGLAQRRRDEPEGEVEPQTARDESREGESEEEEEGSEVVLLGFAAPG